MKLKPTLTRLDPNDLLRVDSFVKKDTNIYESRSSFIRVAIRKLLKEEESKDGS